ncbi:hypothetical protein RQN30_03805 [Arcanobacterium hippocoleae]
MKNGYVRDFEIGQMLIELADYDGDLDAAISLLANREVPYYAEIMRRLAAAGRKREAMLWMEKAIAAKRFKFSSYFGGGEIDVYGPDVLEMYIEDGFPEEAEEFVWKAFQESPSEEVTRIFYDFCVKQGIWDKYETRIWEVIDSQPRVSGSDTVKIALMLNDVERAWVCAEKYGAGYAWQELAAALQPKDSMRSLQLYFASTDELFTKTGSKGAAVVVGHLRKIWGFIGSNELAVQPLLMQKFKEFIAQIRQDYRNRPSLMAQLREAGF